jgi:type IV pilus assembly protein PilC
VALVKTGEASGKLDTVLIRLAESEEKQRQFRSKTKGAMVYPAIVMAAMAIVVTVMMVFVVPQMTSMYESFGAELTFCYANFNRDFRFYGKYLVVGVIVFGRWFFCI